MTRVATPENEKELLHLALGATASQVEKAVRAWRKIDLQVEKAHAEYQHKKRSLTAYKDEDGMVVIRGRLPAEVGAVVLKALEAAADKLYHAEKKVNPNRPEEETSPRQRKADALKLVAESALEGGLDAGTSADRYQVVVHVDEAVLREPASPGQSVLELGEGVSAETSRRMACDASVVEMTHDQDGNILDVGRKTRTIPPAIRRALDARDPTCVWPGCENRFVQGHHIEFWAEGGETKLSNLCNLCYRHHHLVHDGGYRVELAASGAFRFTMPNGREVPDVPPPPRLSADPVAALMNENQKHGLELEGWEGRPKWGYEPMDSWTVDVLWSNSRRRHDRDAMLES